MEEKGGILHIIFLFIGIACISLGVFYTVTDEKIKLDEYDDKIVIIVDDDPNTNTEQDDKNKSLPKEDILNQISIVENMETTVTLKNGSEAKLLYKIDTNEETLEVLEKSFLYNGKKAFQVSESDICDKFFLYNNHIVSYCTSGIYIVDPNGKSLNFDSISKAADEQVEIKSVIIKDNKLIVSGSVELENSQIKKNGKMISLCDENLLKENEITNDYPITMDYELLIEDNKTSFTLLKTTKTVEEYVKEKCMLNN